MKPRAEVPLISIESASTLKSPLSPAPKVPVPICPPFSIDKPLLLLTVKFPPFPSPEVAAEISPPSSTTKLLLLTVKFPPFPVADGISTVLNNPLGKPRTEAPLISIKSALTVKSPLSPAPKVPVPICPPFSIDKPLLLIVKSPPLPTPKVEVDTAPVIST